MYYGGIPTERDIADARQRWEYGYANCEDIAILNWANPQGMHYHSPCEDPLGEIFGIFNWP